VGPDDLKKRIEKGIPGATARVEGADAHFGALVIAGAFEGKTRIEQHQMIYALFRDEMASQEIHALSLKTCTPAEWEREKESAPEPLSHV
jgi:acid stress-induced BolA-like protein IbaG/YrbA